MISYWLTESCATTGWTMPCCGSSSRDHEAHHHRRNGQVSGVPRNELDRNQTVGADRTLARVDGRRLIHFANQRCEARPGRLFETSSFIVGTHHYIRELCSGSQTLAFALNDFGSQLQIGLTSSTFEVVENGRLPIRGRLGHAHVARNNV